MPQGWITPDMAYLLLVSGTVVLVIALIVPGTGLLELAALFLLLAAGYAATQLAVNAWAVAVWIVGIVFFGLSLRRGRREWAWLVLALLAMIAGSVFIFRTPHGGSAVSPWLAVTVSLLVGGSGWLVTRKVLEAESRPPVHDLERLIGQVGEARTDIAPEGSVYLDGEMWTARSRHPLPAGSRVRVVARDGLILQVEPWDETHARDKDEVNVHP